MNKNVPNIITLSRVFLTPIMIVFFMLPLSNGIGKFVAFGIYVLGSLTDAVDGHLARKYNLVSNIGKMLDSIADKFIQTTAIVLILAGTELLPLWAALTCLLIIILRDIWINAIRQICATKGVVVAADVTVAEKLGNFVKRHVPCAQIAYGVERLKLPHAVIAVAGFGVNKLGGKQAEALVMPQAAYAQVKKPGNVADAQ